MKKIWTITSSEYLRRVKSKGFIIATILAPVLLVGIVGIGAGVGYLSAQERSGQAIAIADRTGQLGERLADALPDRYEAVVTDLPDDSLRGQVQRGVLDGYLILPPGLIDATEDAVFVSERGGGFTGDMLLREILSNVVREQRLRAVGAEDDVIAILDQRVGLRNVVITEAGEAADTSWLFSVLGYIMGFVIYLAIFISGAMVLRGVIEEKANRIIEVIASSARPFELLMGKVLGIGAAGLTQIVLWGVLVMLAFAFLAPVIVSGMMPEVPADAPEMAAFEFGAIGASPLVLLVSFVLFFIGGYLLYASLFAAVGSAVESEADAQSLQAPVTIPAIMPIVLLPLVADNPDSTMALVLSLIPLFSPVLMPVRIAAGAAPLWEVTLSLALLAIGFIAAIWVAARIYRVGILMYGKRASFRDLFRWARTA